MRRRTYLACCVGATGGLAGCSGILGGSGGDGDPEGPAAVAEAFLEALIDGDVEIANSLLHENAATDPVDQSTVEGFQAVDAEIEGVTVQSNEDGRAVVEVRISGEGDEGERNTVSFRWELRKEDGEWWLYDDLSAFGSEPAAPSVQWGMTGQTDDGATTSVTFTHEGGDTVQAANFRAVVGDSTATPPANPGRLQTGDAIVVPLDGDGEPLPSGTVITLVWADPESDERQVLSQFRIDSQSVGSVAQTLRIDS